MSGIDIIRVVQSISSPFFDRVFLAITDLHSENIYIILLPVLLWLYDKRFARYMTAVFMLSYWSNNVLKDLFHTARPTPDQVRVVRPETSGAFPSGHAMTPLMFWGAIASRAHRTWITVVVCVFLFLIGLSRLYLGVHWPLDIIGGWTIGAVMLWGFERSRSFWTGENMSFRNRLLTALAVPVGAALISALLGQMPAITDTTEAAQFFTVLGAYIGLAVGGVAEEEYVGFNPRQGGIGAQVLKVVVGLGLVLAVKEGFKLFLPDNGLGDMIRYFFVAAMATFGAPWVFHRFVVPPTSGRTIAG